MSKEVEKRSPYKEFLQGDKLAFDLKTLQPDGSIESTLHQITIADIKGGGFFGKVLIPENENFVIKTSLPDPFHHFWREANWGFKPFPSQTDEKTAQMQHLAIRLIHDVLPVLSNGKFRSPASFGYTKLSTGYAQVIEKMEGRGPRFDLPNDDVSDFKKAQKELTDIALSLGLEQAGQIHPDNPFGMANLWFNDKSNSWIWLDTTPAIPHNGWIWPFFHFKFHKEIRYWFNQKQTTFDTIHMGYFLKEVVENKHLFPPDVYQKIRKDAALYSESLEEKNRDQNSLRRDIKPTIEAAGEIATNLATQRAIYKFIDDPQFRKDTLSVIEKLITDQDFRTNYLNKKFFLNGIDQAKEKGIITDEEWERAWKAVKNNSLTTEEKKVLAGVQMYYIAVSTVLDILEFSAYGKAAASLNDDLISRLTTAAVGFVIGWVLPSIIKPAGTRLIQTQTKVDLRAATVVSAIPKFGTYLAVPAQFTTTVGGDESQLIWHYTVRNMIARISELSPSGGWGTEFEAQLWQKVGKRLESLQARTK